MFHACWFSLTASFLTRLHPGTVWCGEADTSYRNGSPGLPPTAVWFCATPSSDSEFTSRLGIRVHLDLRSSVQGTDSVCSFD